MQELLCSHVFLFYLGMNISYLLLEPRKCLFYSSVSLIKIFHWKAFQHLFLFCKLNTPDLVYIPCSTATQLLISLQSLATEPHCTQSRQAWPDYFVRSNILLRIAVWHVDQYTTVPSISVQVWINTTSRRILCSYCTALYWVRTLRLHPVHPWYFLSRIRKHMHPMWPR